MVARTRSASRIRPALWAAASIRSASAARWASSIGRPESWNGSGHQRLPDGVAHTQCNNRRASLRAVLTAVPARRMAARRLRTGRRQGRARLHGGPSDAVRDAHRAQLRSCPHESDRRRRASVALPCSSGRGRRSVRARPAHNVREAACRGRSRTRASAAHGLLAVGSRCAEHDRPLPGRHHGEGVDRKV